VSFNRVATCRAVTSVKEGALRGETHHSLHPLKLPEVFDDLGGNDIGIGF